jgi:hypothetical protein
MNTLVPTKPPIARRWCLLLSLAALPVANAAPGVKVTLPETNPAPAVAYQRMEWVVELDRTYPNPFDPDQIAVDGLFQGPGGQRLKLPGFWYQEFRREESLVGGERIVPLGAPHWRIRFAPTQPGEWSLKVQARDPSGQTTSAPLTFQVAAGRTRGFVRRSPANTRYFQFDSGDPFFLVGCHIGWGRLEEYETMLTKLARAGGNFTRVWISPPSPAVETKAAGPGRCDLAGAWHYEQILRMADERGIRVQLTLKNYRDLIIKDYWGAAVWPVSPYNKANGGPVSQPADFFSDPQARKLYQHHLRHLIGRYAAFTSLAFWEFWNEQDNIGVGSIAPWIREMAAYLKANDPYQHLVTTSYGAPGESEVWRLPDIDLTQRHFWGEEGSVRDVVPVVAADARLHDVYGKPHMMGELGISWRRSDNEFDPHHTAANLHCGLWAAALSGDAGGANPWFWYDYLEPHDLWGKITPLARFAATINWSKLDFQPLTVPSPTFAPGHAPSPPSDIVLTAAGDWGRADPKPLKVGSDGLVSWTLPTFLYGPEKPDLRTRLTLMVDLSEATKAIVRVTRASNPGTLEIRVDDRPAGRFAFKPEPEPGAGKGNRPEAEAGYPLYAVAEPDRNREFTVPAGAHALVLEVVAGDWLTLESVTLVHARSPRSTGLQPLVLQDRASSETLAWLHDPNSNWYADARQIQPALFENITLEIPVTRAGAFQVQWWDTYKGEIIRTETREAKEGMLSLNPPAFRRDIALRAKPAGPK